MAGRGREREREPASGTKKQKQKKHAPPRRGPAARPANPPTLSLSHAHTYTQTPPPGAPAPAPPTDVRLTTSGASVRLPLLGLAVVDDTPPAAVEAGLAAGVRRWEVATPAAAARLGAALATATADAKAGLALTARIPPPPHRRPPWPPWTPCWQGRAWTA